MKRPKKPTARPDLEMKVGESRIDFIARLLTQSLAAANAKDAKKRRKAS